MASDGPDVFPARPRIKRVSYAEKEGFKARPFATNGFGSPQALANQHPIRIRTERGKKRQNAKLEKGDAGVISRVRAPNRNAGQVGAIDRARRANLIGPAARIRTLGSVLAPCLQSLPVGRFASVPHGGVLDQGGRRWRRRRSPFFKSFLGSQCSGGPRRVCCGFSARPGH